MGCDIHLVLEKKIGDKWITTKLFDGFHDYYDSKWRSPVARTRNYGRFAALASVRGEGLPARGTPDDLSESARYIIEDYGSDGHSHSWLTIEDAAKIFKDTEWSWEQRITPFDRENPNWYYFGLDSEVDNEPMRLIFWFDN